MVKLTLSVPGGTVTLAGRTTTPAGNSVNVTTAPPAGARPSRTIVPGEGLPPITWRGSRKKELTLVAAGVAVTVNRVVKVWAPSVALMVRVVFAETAAVCTPDTRQLLPCGKDCETMVATAGLLLVIPSGT